MQPATSQKKDTAASNKTAAFSASTDKKETSKTAADGSGDASAKKKAGPLAEGPQAKGDKGKVGAKGANKFGKELAGGAGGGKSMGAKSAAAKSGAAKTPTPTPMPSGAGGGGGAKVTMNGKGPATDKGGGGSSGGNQAGTKGGPKAPKPKPKKKAAGGKKSSGAAAAAPGGGGGGGGANTSSNGTRDVAKELVKSPMTKFAKNIGKTGGKLSKSLDKETKETHQTLPEFHATMPGEAQEKTGKKLEKANPDKKVEDGKVGANAKKPKLEKEKPVIAKKSKEGGQAFGKLKKDTPEAIMKMLFGKQTNKITDKSGQNTDPGVEPPIELEGDSDPIRAPRQNTDAQDKITKAAEEADAKIAKIDETELVQRKEMDETLKAKPFVAPKLSEVPADPQMVHFDKKADQHGTAVADAANKDMQAEFEGHLGKADGDFQKAVDEQEKGKAKAVADSEKKIDEANLKAKKDQEKAVKENRKAIDDKKKETKKKQDKEVEKARKKGDSEKKKVEKKIAKRASSDERKIKRKFDQAEKKAEGKKKEAEGKAAKEKKKAEEKKKKKSFWGSICSAIGSFLDKCCALIGDIFDALSKVVGAILNAVKDAALAIVDAAVAFACKALEVLGDILKKLVSGLLGNIFPGLAKALNDLIDKAVNVAKAAVKKIGEVVKKAVAAAIDGLNSAIQKVLSVAKVAIQTALTVASAVVTGDWEKALRALLEGALEMAGISPDSFYNFVGKSMDTIKKIVDNPGKFIGNLISAVGKGFGLFSDNFLKHLTNGLVGWLTGTLSDVGLKMPKNFDIKGIFDIVLQIMGLSKDKLLGKVEKKIGKDNMDLLKTVWGYAEAAIKGGLAGLWEHAKAHLSDLWDTVIDGISSWLVEKLVTQAVIKIASMFNPVGAIVQVVLTAWNVYKFVKEQAAKIYALVQSVVDGMADIVAGNLGPAAKMVEGALAKLVPIVISFLANILGLGGIANKVKDIIGKIQATVDKAVDKVIDKFWELGKKAFKAVKGAFSGDKPNDGKKADDKKPEEKKKEERDPAKLPGATLITKAGTMEMGWSAQKGGNTAITKVTGSSKWGGKVGAKTLPALAKEADKMEGDGKTKAKGFLDTAKRQVISADGSAGAWMRGEHDDLKKVKDSHKLLSNALFEAADAVGAETGGDKDASVKDHKEIVKRAGDEMVKPIGGDPKSYDDWHKELAKRGDQVEQKWQKNLEKDVKIDVSLPNAVAADLKDGSFEVDVKVAPNTTEERRRHELLHDELDPAGVIGTEEYKKSVEKLKAIGAKIGWSAGDIERDAKRIWQIAIETTRRTNSDVRFNDLKPKDDPDARIDLADPAMDMIIADLNPIVAAIEKYISGQAAQYKKGTWGFWSGKPADPIARENCNMTLEKSALGALFDGNQIDGSWHTEMWATLSKAYATWAAKDFEGKTFYGFVGRGSSADKSIFNQIEQPEFKMQTMGAKSEPEVTFFACAGKKKNPEKPGDTKLVPDFSKTAAGLKGVFKSGSRGAMVSAAEAYNEAIQKGEDASVDAGGDPGKIAEVPKHKYKNEDGEDHTLVVTESGGAPQITRHSLQPMPVRGNAFQTAKEIEGLTKQYLQAKDPALLGQIRALLAKLEKDVEFARGEIDAAGKKKEIVAKRAEFETKLGHAALRHKSAKDAVGGMANKAIKLMKAEVDPMLLNADKIDAKLLKRDGLKDNPEFQKLVTRSGMPLTLGFGGAIGKEFDDVIKVFQSGGDLSVKIQHVIQFGTILAEKVYSTENDDLKQLLSKIGVQEGAIKAIIARKDSTDPKAGKEGKTLFGDMKGNREMRFAKTTHKDEGGESKHYEMDMKFPSVPLEVLERSHLELYARQLGISYDENTSDADLRAALTVKQDEMKRANPDNSRLPSPGAAPGAESSPMVRSTRSADDADMALTDKEKKADGLGPEFAPFVEGILANLVDEKHTFIKTARRLKMPLKAGISGTTHRFMNQASMMSAPLHGSRAAILGHLVKINAHSFHEVCTAAKGQVPYKRGEYLPFKPFKDSEMFDIAGKIVETKEEKNILLGVTD